MKKLLLITFLILILFNSCSLVLNTTLNEIGVFDTEADYRHLTNGSREIIYINMHHIGKPEFYNSVKNTVDSLQDNGFVVFYEGVTGVFKDSLEHQTVMKKVRKITGRTVFTSYDTVTNEISGLGVYKGSHKLIYQPGNPELGIDLTTAINADVTLTEMINAFEEKFGVIKLDSCDYNTHIDSVYKCREIGNKYQSKFSNEIILKFRDSNLAGEVLKSDEPQILIIYGEAHYKGLFEILKEKDPSWREV